MLSPCLWPKAINSAYLLRTMVECSYLRRATTGLHYHKIHTHRGRLSHCARSEPLSHKTLFSGIQPTGVPHLGNYLGAVHNWVKLQEEYSKCIFSVVDMHSLTNPAEPDVRRRDIIDTAITLLACGIDPSKSILYQQSDVKEHAELCWILTCMVTEARLKQIPQWKEKAKQQKNYSFGLISYPVLMAADILLYKAECVPVGEDQLQHLQLCRDLASLFNIKYGVELFPQCDWLLSPVPRIRSLRNPLVKMSKSDISEKSRINLDDDSDTIRLRVRQAVTDSTGRVFYDSEGRPGVSNLIDIHSALTGLTILQIEELAMDMNTGEYKLHLSEVIAQVLQPIYTKISELRQNKDYVESVLKDGRMKASNIACQNLDSVKRIIGLK